jgi:dienelactone hydrolase
MSTLVLGSLIAVLGADAESEARIKAAHALLTALDKGDFDGAGKDFDDDLKKLAPAEKLKEGWEKLRKQLGALKKQGDARFEAGAAFIPCEFEKTTLDFKVAFDKEGKITGFFLVPAKATHTFDPPPYAKRDSFTESTVTIGKGEWEVPGTLTMPKGDGPFPGVVLLAGSGPNDRDGTLGPNKPLRDLAWGLATRGIAVVRYDKRTNVHGAKMVRAGKVTVKEEVLDDALSAAALLRKQKGVDPKKVFIAGNSLGAVAAPRLGELDPSLAGLVLLASYTRSFPDVILEQFEYLFSALEKPTAEDKAKMDELRKQVARLKDPKLADIPASELPFGVKGDYYLSLFALDPPAIARKIKQPLLILQGERDYQVTMQDFEGWKKALADRKGVTYKSYPNLTHIFTLCPGKGKVRREDYDKPSHVAEEVVKDIAEWIKRQ